jgi:hypothetical protein
MMSRREPTHSRTSFDRALFDLILATSDDWRC